MVPRRILLLLSQQTYRAGAFLEAASRVGVEVTIGSEVAPALGEADPAGFLRVDFGRPERSIRSLIQFALDHPLAAVIAAEDDEALAAARFAQALHLPHSPPEAVAAALDKVGTRRAIWHAGLRSPAFAALPVSGDPRLTAGRLPYPAIVKPARLSASRGVIRAEDPAALVSAFDRVRALLRPLGEAVWGGESILVESYIPGIEVALEALLHDGAVQPLTLFDKPDPLEGPFFEESIYVTPSRHPAAVQQAMWACVQDCVRALGLTHGAVHAEVRWNASGAWLIELAPRSIGGWCSRSLLFEGSRTLEEVILRDALGEDVSQVRRESMASGVLMLPIPRAGTLVRVEGLDAARAIPAVEDVRMAIPLGDRVEPLPEGNRYLGFAFARAANPAQVELALRQVREELRVVIEPEG